MPNKTKTHVSQRVRNRDRKGEIQRERAGERDPAREPERALENSSAKLAAVNKKAKFKTYNASNKKCFLKTSINPIECGGLET